MLKTFSAVAIIIVSLGAFASQPAKDVITLSCAPISGWCQDGPRGRQCWTMIIDYDSTEIEFQYIGKDAEASFWSAHLNGVVANQFPYDTYVFQKRYFSDSHVTNMVSIDLKVDSLVMKSANFDKTRVEFLDEKDMNIHGIECLTGAP